MFRAFTILLCFSFFSIINYAASYTLSIHKYFEHHHSSGLKMKKISSIKIIKQRRKRIFYVYQIPDFLLVYLMSFSMAVEVTEIYISHGFRWLWKFLWSCQILYLFKVFSIEYLMFICIKKTNLLLKDQWGWSCRAVQFSTNQVRWVQKSGNMLIDVQ